MLVHSVYFWLKENLAEDEINDFRTGLEGLLNIKGVRYGFVGVPAKTEPRPVVDQSYDFCLIVVFDDISAHDSYQTDPIHTGFVDRFKPLWNRVLVYDAT